MSTPTPRRELHFASFDELLVEMERLELAEREGRLRMLGKWSLAQMFQHLGKWIEYSIDGFPFRYPLVLRVGARIFSRLSWKWFYRQALKPGFRNPKQAAAVEPDPSISLEEAADYLRQQVRRVLDGEPMTQPSPAAGPLTPAQWEWIQLRHAEMHLGFTQIADATQPAGERA